MKIYANKKLNISSYRVDDIHGKLIVEIPETKTGLLATRKVLKLRHYKEAKNSKMVLVAISGDENFNFDDWEFIGFSE